jgi:SWI/SNF-related matrix-associated actin-dependent regulator of chromatin subfamily D
MGLLTYEQKLDSLISRKKMEIQEALKRPIKIKRKLRIYVSHSFIHGKEPEVSNILSLILSNINIFSA